MMLQIINVSEKDISKFKTVGNTIRVRYDDLDEIASKVQCRLNEVLAGTATLQVRNTLTRNSAYFSTRIVRESTKQGLQGLFNNDKQEVAEVLQGCADLNNLTPDFILVVMKDKI